MALIHILQLAQYLRNNTTLQEFEKKKKKLSRQKYWSDVGVCVFDKTPLLLRIRNYKGIRYVEIRGLAHWSNCKLTP